RDGTRSGAVDRFLAHRRESDRRTDLSRAQRRQTRVLALAAAPPRGRRMPHRSLMPSIVAMCVRGTGHLQVLLPVIAGLTTRGATVHVMAHADHRGSIERCGGHSHDLFARYPIEAA